MTETKIKKTKPTFTCPQCHKENTAGKVFLCQRCGYLADTENYTVTQSQSKRYGFGYQLKRKVK